MSLASKGRTKVEFNFLLTLRGSSYVVDIHLREKLSPVGDESDYREANTASERAVLQFYHSLQRTRNCL